MSLRILSRQSARHRSFASSSSILLPQMQHRLATSFRPGPSPPKLPAEQQAEFERLQQKASVSQAFQPDADTTAATTSTPSDATAKATGEPSELEHNMALRKGAKPEFEGEVNPKTGEVGGPKNDPLRWKGDWSYNGRVTDF